jgi:hypothetical protein
MTRFIIAVLVGLLASVNAHAAPFPPPNFASCNFTVPTTFKNIWYIDPVKGHTMSAYTAAGVSLNLPSLRTKGISTTLGKTSMRFLLP